MVSFVGVRTSPTYINNCTGIGDVLILGLFGCIKYREPVEDNIATPSRLLQEAGFWDELQLRGQRRLFVSAPTPEMRALVPQANNPVFIPAIKGLE